MTQIIDRRFAAKHKSAVNRHKFIRRYKAQIKKAVSDAIADRSITDIDRGEKINIPAKDISEPVFGHGPGGRREGVHPGNKEFVTGDRIPRPLGGGGGAGGDAGQGGEGEDDFAFELSREEFLELFFEDLELPNLNKRTLAKEMRQKSVRAGYTTDGVPSNINIIRSIKSALSRKIALGAPLATRIRETEAKIAEIITRYGDTDPRVRALRDEVEALKRRIEKIPFIDPFDLRYNNRVLRPEPATQAVMFCLMDVSGSMDQAKKEIAKRFFIILYLFLTRNYEKIDLVFIRHHTVAKEVDEEEFFYSRETGGTVVSSALDLMYRIIRDRYPTSEWNIYAAQASDGDNWSDDSPKCRNLLIDSVLPCVQFYAYIEISDDSRKGLWHEYEKVKDFCPNFAMRHIRSAAEIFPVFRKLFKKRAA